MAAAAVLPPTSRRLIYRPHQQRFIENEVLHRSSPGRIVDHELGSGKTLEVIGAIEALRRFPEFQDAPVLVLTMKALVDGFYSELHKSLSFQPSTRVDLYQVTTTQRFYLHPDEFKYEGGILVVDEAHMLRNPKSKRYRVIFQAAKKVQKTYLMSGTITINYSVDAAPLFNLILSDEKRLKFKEAEAQNAKKVTEAKKYGLEETCYFGYLPVTRTDWDKAFLSGAVNPYLRCLVSHHAENHDSPEYKSHFPQVHRYAVKVSMTEAHYAAYKKEAADEEPHKKRPKMFKRQLDADMAFSAQDIRNFQERIRRGPQLSDTKDVRFLAWIMRLRMACNQLRGADGVEYLPKIAHSTLRIIEQHKANPHYKATLTTTFIARGIRLAQRLLAKAGIKFVTITGQTSDVKDEHDIQRYVRAYNSGEVRVMLFSAAGQHGLDLHGTTDSFILNPHWNVGLHRQAEARVIRYDSHKDSPVAAVNVFYYTTIFPLDRSGRDVSFLPRTADEFLFELGIKKEEENQRLTSMLPTHCMEASGRDFVARTMPLFKKRHHHIQPQRLKRKSESESESSVWHVSGVSGESGGVPKRRRIPKRARG